MNSNSFLKGVSLAAKGGWKPKDTEQEELLRLAQEKEKKPEEQAPEKTSTTTENGIVEGGHNE